MLAVRQCCISKQHSRNSLFFYLLYQEKARIPLHVITVMWRIILRLVCCELLLFRCCNVSVAMLVSFDGLFFRFSITLVRISQLNERTHLCHSYTRLLFALNASLRWIFLCCETCVLPIQWRRRLKIWKRHYSTFLSWDPTERKCRIFESPFHKDP